MRWLEHYLNFKTPNKFSLFLCLVSLTFGFFLSSSLALSLPLSLLFFFLPSDSSNFLESSSNILNLVPHLSPPFSGGMDVRKVKQKKERPMEKKHVGQPKGNFLQL